MKQEKTHNPSHPWIARLIVGGLMILLSFVGLVVSDLYTNGAWYYWRIIGPFFALMCVWLSWYLRKKEHSVSLVKIWHEILHWVALVAAVLLISGYVSMGIIGRFQAGLIVLTILAVTTFIAGIYIEKSYLAIGSAMGLIAAGGAFMQEHLYTTILPTVIVLLGAIWGFIYWQKKRHNMQEKDDQLVDHDKDDTPPN